VIPDEKSLFGTGKTIRKKAKRSSNRPRGRKAKRKRRGKKKTVGAVSRVEGAFFK